MDIVRTAVVGLATAVAIFGCQGDESPGPAADPGASSESPESPEHEPTEEADSAEDPGPAEEADPAEDPGPTEEGDPADDAGPAGEAGEAGEAGGADDDESAQGTDPQVPPLLDVIDDLDEAVVTIAADDGSTARVDVKVAVTRREHQQGLMDVPDLPDGVGMLFVFDDDRTGGFWMYRTLVPLDIAFIEEDGTIGSIMAMDPCESVEAAGCPGYTPPMPYRFALEVPQGWFAAAGVAEGDTVTWTEPVPAR